MSTKCIMKCKGFKQLFAFPEDKNESNKWCKVLQLSKIRPNNRLCDLHFDAKYIGERGLMAGAFPESTKTSKSQPDIIEPHIGIIEILDPERDSTGFETIYITSDDKKTPVKRSETNSFEKRTYKKNVPKQKAITEEIKSNKNAKAARQTTTKINEILDASILGFEPVQSSFQSPPKRTYSYGKAKPKTPNLDITMTCYCRCHSQGVDERHQELLKTIEDLKKTEEEQKQQIDKLISQNKLSEHLLKTKTKRINDLAGEEDRLKKEVDALRRIINSMSIRVIKTTPSTSESSITFARMICAKRKMYSRNEIGLAQKIYSISNRCYLFMRGVLRMNLPHITTLKRQSYTKGLQNNDFEMIEVDNSDTEYKNDNLESMESSTLA